nr:MAG TPA: hypothetical protein [Caudoviricetes sp.]
MVFVLFGEYRNRVRSLFIYYSASYTHPLLMLIRLNAELFPLYHNKVILNIPFTKKRDNIINSSR